MTELKNPFNGSPETFVEFWLRLESPKLRKYKVKTRPKAYSWPTESKLTLLKINLIAL